MILQPKDFKMETTSVWSFKERGEWATHKGDYRGNCSPYVLRNLLLKYTKERDLVLDPFCGSGTTLIECKLLKRHSIGLDINNNAIILAKERLNFKYPESFEPKLYCTNSIYLDSIVSKESVDFIFAHPPYANIIQYSQNINDDLSKLSVDNFLKQIEIFSQKCFNVLKKNKICTVLIGDIRKNGNIIPLGFNIMNIFMNTGFQLKEVIIKEQHNCTSTEYWKNKKINFYLLAHEYIFVLKKS